jgi:Flp pilus assembly protein TadG
MSLAVLADRPSVRPPGKRLARHAGQVMVEFALAVTVLFALVFGIIEVSRLVFTVNALNNAAREASHYAALHPTATSADITAQITPMLLLIDSTNPALFNLTYDNSAYVSCPPPACYYQPVTVTLTYTWNSFVPLLNLGGIPLLAASTVRVEPPPP